jgi:hypothetical protein
METIFDSLGTSVYNLNGHNGYIIIWKLISPFCKKWSRNREPDMERVNEMIEYHNKGGYIPRMIHLAELKEEGIVCYDGNHRKEVFNICNDEDVTCLVDIIFCATQNDVYKAFNNINKAVQLPAIYLEEEKDNGDVIVKILNLVKQYEAKYKQLLSTSPRCHAPNFNRDSLTDNIYNIYKSLGNVISIEHIGSILERLNNEYSRGRICRPHSSYKESVVEKCKKYNMWLFIEKTIPVEHVEMLVNS